LISWWLVLEVTRLFVTTINCTMLGIQTVYKENHNLLICIQPVFNKDQLPSVKRYKNHIAVLPSLL
jgi:hypothetical protein